MSAAFDTIDHTFFRNAVAYILRQKGEREREGGGGEREERQLIVPHSYKGHGGI